MACISQSSISPSDEQLIPVLRTLRTEYPTLGIIKFHTYLLTSNPSWTVSEKRLRKLLQQQGLGSVPAAGIPLDTALDGKVYPTFRITEHLNIGTWTSRVEVKYFGLKKGKGLVAKQKIEKGEKVWMEDPWIIAPEWEIFYAQEVSLACTHCTTPLSESRLIMNCSFASSCPARFCNRRCLAKAASSHPLLCRAQNPAVRPLLNLARQEQWLALHALAQQTATLLLENERGNDKRDTQWKIIKGFAEMGMEDRLRHNGQTTIARERTAWKTAHQLYLQAFRCPTDGTHQKKLVRLLKRTLPDDIESEVFSYEGFLRGLGRMNLNLEAHGGLYILHSHLNHSCTPNLSVRHFDQRSALSRITLIAIDDIEQGKELLITYVNPNGGVQERRQQLREWGFGECCCTRCIKEAAELASEELKPSKKNERDGSIAVLNHTPDVDQADLERELREGFGL